MDKHQKAIIENAVEELVIVCKELKNAGAYKTAAGIQETINLLKG